MMALSPIVLALYLSPLLLGFLRQSSTMVKSEPNIVVAAPKQLHAVGLSDLRGPSPALISSSVGGGSGSSSGAGLGSTCPRVCFCNSPSRIVYCSRRGLTAIPEGVSTDSLQLNLNGNSFQSSTIVRSNLSHFSSLEHLYLSECQLEHIDVGAFDDLSNLRWLDLSNNRLRTIKADTFGRLQLQYLFLNGNRNIQLLPDSFAGLVTTGLYLHDCSLPSLNADVLDPLNTTLRYLWLNGNELTRLDPHLAAVFSRLNHVRLGSNPLRCGCESVWLKQFFDRNSDAFRGAMAPSCLYPNRLRGRLFNELTLHDLHCQSPSFTALEAHFDPNVGQSSSTAGGPSLSDSPTAIRLRCAAVGDPAPTLYWVRPNGKTTRYDRTQRSSVGIGGNDVTSPDDDEVNFTEAVLELSTSSMAAASATGDDFSSGGGTGIGNTELSGTYTCIANNEAGNVTLTVSVPTQRHLASNSNRKYVPSSTVSPSSTSFQRFRPTTATSWPHHLSSQQQQLRLESNMQSNLLGDSLNLLHLRRLQLVQNGGSGDSTSSKQHQQQQQQLNQPGGQLDPVYRMLDGPGSNRSVGTRWLELDVDATAISTRARFSSADMAWAVVGTHVSTLALCAGVFLLCRTTSGSSRRYFGIWNSLCCGTGAPAWRRRNKRKLASHGGSTLSSSSVQYQNSGGGLAACRALKAAYERRRLMPNWSRGGGGDVVTESCTAAGTDGEDFETSASCPALDVHPVPACRPPIGAGGGTMPSRSAQTFRLNDVDSDASETVYLNGFRGHGRYAVPSYCTTDMTQPSTVVPACATFYSQR